ncbi:MAG: DUF2332 domain-containing protein [Alphaproteobacteria bacterium]|nr:DUF2332 domain-containing protein [Alphaproteobacteria bacterium]
MTQTPATLEEVARAADIQIMWCQQNGAPFTAQVLQAIRENLTSGGTLARLMTPWPGNPLADALLLRATGALHFMVRIGKAPDLAAYYPGHGDKPWDAGAGRAIEDAVVAHLALVKDTLSRPPQTNETGRSAVLMPGYAEIARRTGLPLSILEIGASAGLNLLWDRFAYRYGDRFVGDTNASVVINAEWRGTWCNVEHLPRVVAKRGCDRTPFDLSAPGAADRLIAYVWPEQKERLVRIEAAIALAQGEKPSLEKADAGDWLERQLASQVPGAATVIAHTIVWQYIARETREKIEALLKSTGDRATEAAPLAWLTLEQYAPDQFPEVRLTLWPGGQTQKIATAHPHGAWIEWLL